MTKSKHSSDLPKQLGSQKIVQRVVNVKGNSTQVIGDYNSQKSFNFNLIFSVFYISILALGGIAWALNIGQHIQGPANHSEPSHQDVLQDS